MGKGPEEVVKNRAHSTIEGLALTWRDPRLTPTGFQKGKWER